jgi:hypothetical protein
MSDGADRDDEPPRATEADVGKTVIAPTGIPIGEVIDVERGIPIIEVEDVAEPSAEGVVGLTSGDGRMAIPLDRILDISDETIHLR